MVSIVVTILWFNNGNLALGGDVAAIPFDPTRMAPRYLSAWNFWIDSGNPIPSAISNQVPTLDFLFYYSLHLMNLSLSSAQSIYIVLFSYFLPAISTYSLVVVLFDSKLRSSRLAGFVAGLFAILNPIYVYSTGYTSILNSPISRASLPLALFLVVAGFKKRDLRYGVALGLSSVLVFAVFARAIEFGFLVLIAVVLAAPHASNFLKGRHPISPRFAFRFVGVSCIIAIGANLFWLIPFLGVYPVFYDTLAAFPVSSVSFESQFTTLQNVLRLQGYWPFFVGTYVPYSSYYFNSVIWVGTFAIPAIAIAGLSSWRVARRESISLGFLVALLLALGQGTNLPFGIFTTLIQSVPFLKLYKDPWIFLEPLSLLYSILFGVSMASIAEFASKHIHRRHIPKIASIALAMLVLGMISWPVLSGAVFENWYQPSQRGVAVPPEYAQLNNWLSQDNCGCAALIVPKLSGSYVATKWGFQGPNDLYQNLFSVKLVTGSGPPIYGLRPAPEKQIVDYIYTLMSAGDPLFSPNPINATSQIQYWHFSVKSQTASDTVTYSRNLTPWNESALEWNFGPISEGTQNGHSIYFLSKNTMDLSTQRWALFWASSSIDWTKLVFGIGDDSGNVAWYPFAQHVLLTDGQWNLFDFPLNQPDVRASNLTSIRAFFLNYGLFSENTVTATGSGMISFGHMMTSAGYVPEKLIQFLLGSLNVKYLVMDKSIDSMLYPQLDLRPYESTFFSWTKITLVKNFGSLLVYENSQYGSLISAPKTWIQISNIYQLPNEFGRARGTPEALGYLITNDQRPGPTTYNATIESVTQTGPTSFNVRLVSAGNFLLVLSTAFDNNWHATINGVTQNDHVLADGYSNGWLINESGETTVQIVYQPQSVYDASLLVSLLTLVIVSAALCVPRLVRVIGSRLQNAIPPPDNGRDKIGCQDLDLPIRAHSELEILRKN